MQTALTAEYLLTATYSRAYCRIVVRYMSDDSAEVSSLGDVTDDEEMAAVDAQGADLAGWTCSLS